jgi:hypothetical protein
MMKKCLVLDLDNTLWGGVVGEDGIDNLALSVSAPGNSFLAFQQAILDYYNKGLMSLSAEQRWAGFSQKLLAKVYQGQKLTTAEKRIAAEVTGFEGDFESYLEKQTEHLCYLEDQGIHFSVNGWAFDWNAKLKFTDRAQDPKLRQALELFFPPVIIGALQDPHRRLPLFLGDQVILPEPRSGSSRNKMAMSFSAWKERLAEQLESYQESFRIYAESIQVQSSTTNYLFMDHQEHDAWWKLYETSMRLLEKQRQQLADSGYSDQQLVFLTQQEQALGDRFRENLQGVQSDLKIMKFTAPVLLVATIVAPEFVIPTMGVCLGSSMVVSLGMAGAASAYSDEGYWQAFSRYYLEQGTQTFIYAPAFMLIPMSAGLLAARPLLRQFTPEWLQCS